MEKHFKINKIDTETSNALHVINENYVGIGKFTASVYMLMQEESKFSKKFGIIELKFLTHYFTKIHKTVKSVVDVPSIYLGGVCSMNANQQK